MDSINMLTSAKIKKIITLAGLGIQILLGIIFLFTGLEGDFSGETDPLYHLFDSTYLENSKLFEITLGVIEIISLVALFAFSAIGLYKALTRKKGLTIQACSAGSAFALILFGAIGNIIVIVIPIILFIFALLLLAYLIFFYKTNKEEAKIEAERGNEEIVSNSKEDKNINLKAGILPSTILVFVSLVASFLIFVLPVCKFDGTTVFKLFDVFDSEVGALLLFNTDFQLNLIVLISFAIFFFAYVYLILDTSKVLTYSKNNPNKFYALARKNLYSSFAVTICYFVYAIAMEFVLYKQLANPSGVVTTNISFIPLIIMSVIIIAYSIITSRYTKDESKLTHKRKVNRLITLALTIAFAGLLVGCVLSNLISIEVTGEHVLVDGVVGVKGYDILKDSNTIDSAASHFQLFAFVIYITLIIAAVIVVLSVCTFIRGSKYFYKTSLISIIAAFMGIFALALFSKYYSIAEEVNKELMKKVVMYYLPGMPADAIFETKVTTDTDIFLFGALGLFGLLAIFRPYSQQIKEEGLDVNIKDLEELGDAIGSSGGGGGGVGLAREDIADSKSKDFDSCPAFSEIDGDEAEINEDIEERRKAIFNHPSLPSLVRFIVDYARESRLHLSYKEEDIAQFVAGLGSSKLSILQGMSGTGKTSLPKIFCEAILGNVNIIEVESSWKDKNELIGYFNEFSGKFTPKKFTQSLYRAAFYNDVVTFIVLDEMNLSRIEYYFSDFLSLMENEPDKREIKLLNVQLKNFKSGVNLGYKQLKKGHTLKVSPNVWFIGTANRDESTFEISDKVYDRAMTMNFMKRAPKIDTYSDPIDQRFLDYETFNGLLEKACNSFRFDVSNDPTIKAVERLLAPYNISFGNRIERQIEKFVAVYCSCFTDSSKMVPVAVEKILFSKVVAKLEFKSVENKEELAHSFEELGLLECAAFINKLNGDL